MLNNLSKYLSILLLFSGSNLPALTSINLETNNSKIISTDYLNKLPPNDYILGSGDNLSIVVSRDYPELTSTSVIDGEGTIYLPKLNRVFVKGLNIAELQDILNKAYGEFIKFPNVEVIVTEYRVIRVLVSGEVENPGLQTLKGSFKTISEDNQIANVNNNSFNKSSTSFFPTVFDAIRMSGGITPFTDLTNVQVIRKNNLSEGGGFKTATIDFSKVLISGETTQNIRIYDGDVIKLKKSKKENKFLFTKAILSNLNSKFISVFITGRVVNPGKTAISKASVLTDAVDIAGGVKVLKGPVLFIRFNNDGTIDKRKFKYKKNAKRGSYSNPMLRNGDLIFVDQNFLTSTNEIVNEVTSPFIGIFSAYGLIKAISE